MANYSLQVEPLENNVYDALLHNTLGNNNWISQCLKILLTMDNAIVAFDADWGNGKTFLAKQFEMIINEKWEISNGNQSNRNYSLIPNLDFNGIPDNSYYAIYYNAWEYDNENNPMASFLYYLLKMLGKKIDENKFENFAKNFIVNVIEKLTDGWVKINVDGKQNTLKKVLNSVIESDYIREQIRVLLSEFRKERFNNIVIIIDELDRCRPDYALKVIEMIKHYLRMENVLVLCMTDTKQLSSCIGSIYGNKYDSGMYLDKIFDFQFKIPVLNDNIDKYVRMRLNSSIDIDCLNDACIEVIRYFDLSLRSIDKYLGYIGAVVKKNKRCNGDFAAKAFAEYIFTPYYVAMMLFSKDKLDMFMNFNFNDYFAFCKRENIIYYIKSIYRISKNNDYDESKLFDYLSRDCEIVVKQLKGVKNINENYIVNANCFGNFVEMLISKIDMLNFFIENTKL